METTGIFRANARYIRRSSYLTSNPVTALPISIRWISDVPSKFLAEQRRNWRSLLPQTTAQTSE